MASGLGIYHLFCNVTNSGDGGGAAVCVVYGTLGAFLSNNLQWENSSLPLNFFLSNLWYLAVSSFPSPGRPFHLKSSAVQIFTSQPSPLYLAFLTPVLSLYVKQITVNFGIGPINNIELGKTLDVGFTHCWITWKLHEESLRGAHTEEGTWVHQSVEARCGFLASLIWDRSICVLPPNEALNSQSFTWKLASHIWTVARKSDYCIRIPMALAVFQLLFSPA